MTFMQINITHDPDGRGSDYIRGLVGVLLATNDPDEAEDLFAALNAQLGTGQTEEIAATLGRGCVRAALLIHMLLGEIAHLDGRSKIEIWRELTLSIDHPG